MLQHLKPLHALGASRKHQMRGCKSNEAHRGTETRETNLRSLTSNSIQHRLKGRLAKAAVQTGLFVVLKAMAESLGSVVKGVTKRFVDALDVFSASHKDLVCQYP